MEKLLLEAGVPKDIVEYGIMPYVIIFSREYHRKKMKSSLKIIEHIGHRCQSYLWDRYSGIIGYSGKGEIENRIILDTKFRCQDRKNHKRKFRNIRMIHSTDHNYQLKKTIIVDMCCGHRTGEGYTIAIPGEVYFPI